jgi:hypothetical protein
MNNDGSLRDQFRSQLGQIPLPSQEDWTPASSSAAAVGGSLARIGVALGFLVLAVAFATWFAFAVDHSQSAAPGTALPVVSDAPRSTSVPGCSDCVIRSDAVLGISFPAPRTYYYEPARLAQSADLVLTETARLSSYPLEGTRPSDLSRELLVEFFLAPSKGEDLTTIASTRLSWTPPLTRRASITVAGRPALLLDGSFQNGTRTYVLVQVDSNRILVVSAFPTTSGRISDFDLILERLTFDP